MPLRLPDQLPAIEVLKKENIFVMNETRAHTQMVRPLQIVVLNLMPLKITTETDLVRLLSNTPLQIEINCMRLKSHTPKNTPVEHMQMFYKSFKELSLQKWDGMIVTGAPIELLPFEDVEYWEEIKTIFNWARTHVTSTLYICWAAQAGLYHFYNIPKHTLSEKKFGIFRQYPLIPDLPIFRGFDDSFMMPHSRHTEVRRSDLEKEPALQVIAESAESGVSMIMARGGREFFITGHLEYAPDTLDKEYKRDFGKRQDVAKPLHYYRDDDPTKGPVVSWRSHANLFFCNWINYYVYQETPYNIDEIE